MPIHLPGERHSSRLSLWHFFLWIALASVLAARTSVPLSIDVLLATAINSAAITAAIVAIYQATLNSEWVDAHPGHWCAMVVLWVYVDQWLVTPKLIELAPRHEEFVYAVFFVGAGMICLVGMLVGDWGRAWKFALAAHAAAFALAGSWRIMQAWGWQATTELVRGYLVPPVDMLAVALVVIAVLMDFWWKELRDWKHWAGLFWFGFHWYEVVRAYVAPHVFS